MTVLLWVLAFVAAALVAPSMDGPMKVMFIPVGGFLQALLPFLPTILGGAASLLKGKKTKYAAQQTPQQQAAYNQLLKMLQQRMGGQSAGMGASNTAQNILSSMFLGRGYTPQGQSGTTQSGQGSFPLLQNLLKRQ